METAIDVRLTRAAFRTNSTLRTVRFGSVRSIHSMTQFNTNILKTLLSDSVIRNECRRLFRNSFIFSIQKRYFHCQFGYFVCLCWTGLMFYSDGIRANAILTHHIIQTRNSLMAAQIDHCMIFSVIALRTVSSSTNITNKSVRGFGHWSAFTRPKPLNPSPSLIK